MSKKLLKRTLDYLRDGGTNYDEYMSLMQDIACHLTKPDPEPVAFRWFGDEGFTFSLFQSEESPGDPLYTTPPDQSAQIAELEKQVSDRDEALAHKTVQLHKTQAKQEPIAYITGWYGGYPTINIIDGAVLPNGTPLYAAPPERKPIGYIPAYADRIIHNEGAWDAFHLYKTQTDPTDIEVFL